MSFLSASSSSFPALSQGQATLAHSYNSSGRLGMFVNPHACSCATCVDHVAAERPSTPPPEPLVTLAPPPPLARSVGLGFGAFGGAATPRFWSALAHATTDEEPTPTPPSLTRITSPPLVRFTGPALARSAAGPSLARAATSGAQTWAAALAEAPALDRTPSVSEAEEDGVAAYPEAGLYGFLDEMRTVRSSLVAMQDSLAEEDHRSHDEMAAADQRFDDLDRKIEALEAALRAFGVPFRARA